MDCPSLIAKYEFEVENKQKEREKEIKLIRSSRTETCSDKSADGEKKRSSLLNEKVDSTKKPKSAGRKEASPKVRHLPH